MQKISHAFVFDVESVGLHGKGFAVGGGVYSIMDGGSAASEFRYSVQPSESMGDQEGFLWVSKNVPYLGVTAWSLVTLRDAFWSQWLDAKAKYPGIAMWAECGWPVEARFLASCIDDSQEERFWQGPYPLHDVATAMLMAGMDPMEKYQRSRSEMPEHDPLADARLSARLLAEASRKFPH